MKRSPTKLLLAFCIMLGFAVLTGCNTFRETFQGAGQDLNAVGQTINPPPHKVQRVSKTTTTTTSTDADSTTQTATTNTTTDNSDIPEESY